MNIRKINEYYVCKHKIIDSVLLITIKGIIRRYCRPPKLLYIPPTYEPYTSVKSTLYNKLYIYIYIY